MIRKWISVLVVLAMLISVTPLQALSADVASGSQGLTAHSVNQIQATVVNPEYAHLVSVEDIAPPQYGKLDFGDVNYLTEEEATATVREAMKKRQTEITVNFYTYETDVNTGAFAPFYAAFTHTGDPAEGDYLSKQYRSCNVGGNYLTDVVGGAEVIQFQITYTVVYMSNAAQEAQMDTAVTALLETLDLECADDYTKFITVYDYICQNITYDYDNLADDTYLLKHSAYAALINKTAVCQGYALLLYRLLLELGVDCRYVSGIGNGGAHGWNIVELDGKYYNVDSTWDATYRQAGYDYQWCLLNQMNFTDHYRDTEYDTAEFHSEYPMATANYVYSGTSISHTYVTVVTPSTCTAQGYTTYTCQVCDDSYIANYTDALGHSYVEGICAACEAVQIIASGTCGENLTWVLDGKGTLTISGTGAMYDYWNPNYAPWYSNRSSIKTVVIEDGVTTIGGEAFSDCGNLAEIIIPNSVTYIGSCAFWECSNLTGITIPDGITCIESGTFFNTGLTAVTIPNGVTRIDMCAFEWCRDLTSITIPDSVTSIGEAAFSGCTSLTTINIPYGVISIDMYVFAHCEKLTNITLSDSVMAIGGHTFSGCTSLTNITLPKNITCIDWALFKDCTSLTSITIPEGVTIIDEAAFQNCTTLTEITIPQSVTIIDVYAFEGCSGLTGITIPESVTEIAPFAFEGCGKLAHIYYTGDQSQWEQIQIWSGNDPLLNATLHSKSAIVYGDATGDGVIDGLDVIRLKKYLANYNYDTGTSTIEISDGADATGDGVIDGLDVIRLKKYLANYNYDTGTSTIPLGPQ